MHLIRRDKLVYFRISGDEFEAILSACQEKGARSVSDLARMAVQEFIKSSHNQPEQQMDECLIRLQGLVDELKQTIQRLGSTVANIGAGGAQDIESDRAHGSTK